MVARQTWDPITASSRKQSTIVNSGEKLKWLLHSLELVCEGMGQRQQWNWVIEVWMQCQRDDTADLVL